MSNHPQTPKFPFPIPLLILDGIGSLMLAVGVVVLVSEPDGLPGFLKWASEDGIWLLVSGMALMLPMIVFIIQKARGRNASP